MSVSSAPQLDLDDIRARYFSALLSDVLDDCGYTRQALPARIRPLDESLVMVGRARTGLYLEIFDRPAPGENPYELEIKLVDSLKKNEIAVFSCGTSGRIAPWGGLLSTAAQYRGSAGALMDGFVRDVREIRDIGYPVFHGGIGPIDCKGRGKVVEIDVVVECAGVRVAPGDLIFGDVDGVVVIPQEVEAEVLAKADERLKGERNTLAELAQGALLADVYAKYGVL